VVPSMMVAMGIRRNSNPKAHPAEWQKKTFSLPAVKCPNVFVTEKSLVCGKGYFADVRLLMGGTASRPPIFWRVVTRLFGRRYILGVPMALQRRPSGGWHGCKFQTGWPPSSI